MRESRPEIDCALVYTPAYQAYRLRPGHPFDPVRATAALAMIEACGLLPPGTTVTPSPATEAELLTVHSEPYLRAVQDASDGIADHLALHYGIGTPDTPAFPGMHQAAAALAGGTLTAARAVAEGKIRRALNLGGGLHHAHRAKASGFCVYNDLSVAITDMRSRGLRVAYVDIDAHHGDGVQWNHYEDPDVLTVSLHETGRHLFPGTGFTYELGRGDGIGTSLNLPLEPYTQDGSFLEGLEVVLHEALAWFRPDVILLQAGADAHFLDPLADLALTTQGMRRAFEIVSDLADLYCGGRLIATGGGGYATLTAVPRVWTELWAVVSRQTTPPEVPPSWLEGWNPQAEEALPDSFVDEPPHVPRLRQVEERNRHTVQRLLREWRQVTGQ